MHEIAGFLPDRLKFKHEFNNVGENPVKDLEFGACLTLGSDAIPEDNADPDSRLPRGPNLLPWLQRGT